MILTGNGKSVQLYTQRASTSTLSTVNPISITTTKPVTPVPVTPTTTTTTTTTTTATKTVSTAKDFKKLTIEFYKPKGWYGALQNLFAETNDEGFQLFRNGNMRFKDNHIQPFTVYLKDRSIPYKFTFSAYACTPWNITHMMHYAYMKDDYGIMGLYYELSRLTIEGNFTQIKNIFLKPSTYFENQTKNSYISGISYCTRVAFKFGNEIKSQLIYDFSNFKIAKAAGYIGVNLDRKQKISMLALPTFTDL